MDDLADDLIPQRSLVCAIVALVIRDCCYRPTSKEGLEALRWLESREALEFCEAWNVDLRKIKRAVSSKGYYDRTKGNPDSL